MTQVLFYHLTERTLEQVLPGLLEKCLERGWRAVGRRGTKETCLDYIEEVWTDMKPAERMRLKELIRRL